MSRRLARPLLIIAVLFALHGVGALVLDRAELVERLLSPHGSTAAPALLAAAAFWSLRLALVFVIPGAILTRIVLAVIEWTARRGTLGRTGGLARANRDAT